MIGIYKIENLKNGKVYIGQTINFNRRKNSHFSSLKRGKHFNEHLQNSYNLNSKESFIITFIIECSEKLLDDLEKYFIEYYNSSELGYNLMLGGQKHRRFTKEIKLKMSESGKGRIFTETHKNRISESQKGKIIKQSSIEKCKLTKLKNKSHVGEKNHQALISDDVARNIINELLKKVDVKTLTKKYKTSKYVIYNLLENKSYKHIMSNIREDLKCRHIEKKSEKYKLVLKLYQEGNSQNKISKLLCISRNTIRKLLNDANIEINH